MYVRGAYVGTMFDDTDEQTNLVTSNLVRKPSVFNAARG